MGNSGSTKPEQNEGLEEKKSNSVKVAEPPKVKVAVVAQKLIKNEILVQTWAQFYGTLSLADRSTLIVLEQGYKNGTLSPLEIFNKIISAWVSEQGKNAMCKKIMAALRKDRFQSTADELKNWETCLVIH